MLTALPLAFIHTLAGLALLSTIAGSLHQALSHERERDAAIVTFLVTASGLTAVGVGSAFWGLVAGGFATAYFHSRVVRNCEGVMPKVALKR